MRLTLPTLLSLAMLATPALACAGNRTAAPPSTAGDVEAPTQSAEAVAERSKKKKKADEKMADKPAAAKKGPQSGMNGAAANPESFRKAVDAVSSDALKTADLFVQALAAYSLNRELGLEMLAMLLQDDDLIEDDGVMLPNRFRQDELFQLDKKPNIMKGYCGGTVAKAYEDADVPNCKATFDTNYSSSRQGVGYPAEDKAKFFITNGGSSRPRPVELELHDGRWLMDKYGVLSGVAKPE
ncbi:MAG: hypothetical protein KDA24_25965 [Deltaproteobacteria bacterium]|nr:hypothetical protein [Deltaproteobacteria bacterium]